MTPDSQSGSGRPADVRPPAAEAEAIWKSFGRTKALQDVSVSVQPGECHALVGRNGAGKSTLVGVLTGLLRPDRGSVRLYGEPAPSLGNRAAWQERVACVYQRSMVIPSLSVGENIFLNRNEGSLVRWRELRRQARQLLFEWGFDLDVDQPVSELSVEQKQVVEIARALAIGARFLILDEPTASLESHAIERLFERVRRVKASGVGILYISHHLEEVYEICDRATVLRDGKQIVSAPVTELDHEHLVAAMVGGALARTTRETGGAARPRRGAASTERARPLGADAARLGRGREPRRARRRVRRALRPSRLGHDGDRRRGRRARQAVRRGDRARREAAAAGQGRCRAAARCRLRARRTATPAALFRRSALQRISRSRSWSACAAGGSSRVRGGATPPTGSPGDCRSSRAAAASPSRS